MEGVGTSMEVPAVMVIFVVNNDIPSRSWADVGDEGLIGLWIVSDQSSNVFFWRRKSRSISTEFVGDFRRECSDAGPGPVLEESGMMQEDVCIGTYMMWLEESGSCDVRLRGSNGGGDRQSWGNDKLCTVEYGDVASIVGIYDPTELRGDDKIGIGVESKGLVVNCEKLGPLVGSFKLPTVFGEPVPSDGVTKLQSEESTASTSLYFCEMPCQCQLVVMHLGPNLHGQSSNNA